MNKNSPIRLLIIDDSIVFCRFLSINLPKENPRINVVGYCTSATDALKKIPILKPDVVSLDIEMPQMNGIEFLKQLLPQYPIPVVLVSSLNVNVFDVLSYGAVDFVKKPDGNKNNSPAIFAQNLVSKIITASTVKIRNKFKYISNANNSTQNASPVQNLSSNLRSNNIILQNLNLKDPNSLKLKNTIIAIGASTGGTETILEILKKLPKKTPGIVITQHMPEGFTNMYAQRLNRLCQMEVKEAKDGDIVEQGKVLIAPGGDYHMKVESVGANCCVRLINTDKVNGHKPSVDVLFSSVAKLSRLNTVGIILTGMGNDGAKGLLEIRKNKGFTIGQDKESSIVYGMPMEAFKIGAICKQTSCSNISNVLISYLNSL